MEAKIAKPGAAAAKDAGKYYPDLTRLIERLHRRFLDVLRLELSRMGVKDINAVQALLIANIGGEDVVIRDLVERGYYQGSNVSYNIKKLADLGYLEPERTQHDRRSVRVKLTNKALDVAAKVREIEQQNAKWLSAQKLSAADAQKVCEFLGQLEHIWTDRIRFGD